MSGQALTAAQVAALVWLGAPGTRGPWRSSDLQRLYAERYRAELEREDRKPYIPGWRYVAWCRASGSVMSRMERQGFLRFTESEGFTARYMLTEQGVAALASAAGDMPPTGR